ncbi:hypothetical protein L1O03_10310 [Corynebacterium uropygiale]|uniref:Uncharacterized protein n=1 Tax=Corynebacterium uropygiale TaxID=1775911 RepID=A0A9X1QQ38_9CORY|nr:hypothetical protein [Corynebacterium uropygiale]MCF4007557.1 hypothetical protein [Corynebacterium uropygiale]
MDVNALIEVCPTAQERWTRERRLFDRASRMVGVHPLLAGLTGALAEGPEPDHPVVLPVDEWNLYGCALRPDAVTVQWDGEEYADSSNVSGADPDTLAQAREVQYQRLPVRTTAGSNLRAHYRHLLAPEQQDLWPLVANVARIGIIVVDGGESPDLQGAPSIVKVHGDNCALGVMAPQNLSLENCWYSVEVNPEFVGTRRFMDEAVICTVRIMEGELVPRMWLSDPVAEFRPNAGLFQDPRWHATGQGAAQLALLRVGAVEEPCTSLFSQWFFDPERPAELRFDWDRLLDAAHDVEDLMLGYWQPGQASLPGN